MGIGSALTGWNKAGKPGLPKKKKGSNQQQQQQYRPQQQQQRPVVGSPRSSKSSHSHSNAVARRVSAPKPMVRSSSSGAVKVAKPVAPPPKAVAPKPPAPPDINAYLRGDTTYLAAEAGFNKASKDYNTKYASDNQRYGEEYLLNKSNLAKTKVEADVGLSDDYGSRGMMNSGLYNKAYADQEIEYNGRQAAMNNARTQFNADQASNKTNFDTETGLSRQNAREGAIGRRAAKYNIK